MARTRKSSLEATPLEETSAGGTTTTAADSTSFQGQAAAVSGFAMGSAVSVADTGPLSAAGSAQEATAMETALATGLLVGASHATTVGQADAASSQATVANVSFTGSSVFMAGATVITADFVMAQAGAVCLAAGATVSGQVQITGLIINGQAVAVSGAANQMVFLADGGFVIINEQTVVQTATTANITVNALHVFDTFASVNLIFASASAGITCASTGVVTAPTPCDFLTGGGWITGTPSGAKATSVWPAALRTARFGATSITSITAMARMSRPRR